MYAHVHVRVSGNLLLIRQNNGTCQLQLCDRLSAFRNGSEDKRGPNAMDGRSCKGETNRVNVKHILLNAQDITVGAFLMARLNSLKY